MPMQGLTQQPKRCRPSTIWAGTLLPHLPYIPELAPSHFHLFGPLKEFTKGTNFESDDEVKSVVSDWQRIRLKILMLREYGSLCTDGKMCKADGRLS